MNTPRGFTLLIAVLVSGILLALGLAIYNIAAKELILSSAGRDSQFAFYAADSGIECARYWDKMPRDAFATTSSAMLSCGGAEVSDLERLWDPIARVYTVTFGFSLGTSLAAPCTKVTLVRQYTPTRTALQSHGYNTCVESNPRRLERAILMQF